MVNPACSRWATIFPAFPDSIASGLTMPRVSETATKPPRRLVRFTAGIHHGDTEHTEIARNVRPRSRQSLLRVERPNAYGKDDDSSPPTSTFTHNYTAPKRIPRSSRCPCDLRVLRVSVVNPSRA